jgi:hypothetical protein
MGCPPRGQPAWLLLSPSLQVLGVFFRKANRERVDSALLPQQHGHASLATTMLPAVVSVLYRAPSGVQCRCGQHGRAKI